MNFAQWDRELNGLFPNTPTIWSANAPIPVICKPFSIFWQSITPRHWLNYHVTCNIFPYTLKNKK